MLILYPFLRSHFCLLIWSQTVYKNPVWKGLTIVDECGIIISHSKSKHEITVNQSLP